MENLFLDNKTKQRIRDGIENYRKGFFSIRFVDKNNKHIDIKDIKIRFSKHYFEFGINVFMVNEFLDSWKNNIYEEKLTHLFNTATLPFYWSFNEPEEGEYRFSKECEKVYRRPSTDLCLEFCKKNSLKPRLHGLAYERYFPDWLKKYSNEEVKNKLEKRMEMISSLYKNDIPLIEVTNEMHYEEGVTSYYKDENYIVNCFKTAKNYFTNNKLLINEAFPQVWDILNGDKLGVYYSDIKNAIEKGAPIDEIQFQFHMFFNDFDEYKKLRGKFYNIGYLLEIIDKYAEFNLPIGISEVTIPAYSNNFENENEQAEVLKTLYSAWFSHKYVNHITYWNLVDGTAGGTYGDMNSSENVYYGGLLRFDMTEKPSYKILDNLINHEWTTNLDVVSSSNGLVNFKGFYGEYDVIFGNNKFHVNLTPNNREAIIRIN